ncbi:phosphatidylglycerol/phosphatidylinositol transfer protein precursor [Moelleriella libera RCEF 2490]|uniref:Phosphatidylglycerol/phosphatidylinositol transfer protein n=1 Tax=Moelleriella libera RCEF 2490 TaxID=1081109 RepID=A0A168EUT2_9HYPO|nr:phosphatidylglycerol/phosphatidylinositol transfer protein precursor [Moelleriella libera RCEF 2490]
MRLFVVVLPALVASTAALGFFNGNPQKGLGSNKDLKIPGESPLEFCANKEEDGYIEIKKVDLDPNPPVPGKDLYVAASGEVKKTIEAGAYLNLTVKYGIVTLLKQTADLCEQMGEVDIECPVEPGKVVFTKTVELPQQIPPGTYHVEADVFAANHERITCLTATVQFKVPQGKFFSGDL